MLISFNPTSFADLEAAIKAHWNSLPSAIDSFLEDHILGSNHYRIYISGEAAGFASVHGGNLITQFALGPSFKRYGQPVFQAARKLEEVQAAFVPTCEEFFLSHALDDYRKLHKQAYFFSAPAEAEPPSGNFNLRLAQPAEAESIEQNSGDFFSNVADEIAEHRLYLIERNQTPVAFGVLHRSKLIEHTASIGMFVVEAQRQQGIGTATLKLLRLECQQLGLRAIAGCWYYNHLSKKTLERSGMHSQTRLLRVEY